METIFFDLNASLNHVMSFVGASSVKRKDGKTYVFSDFQPYSVFLSLLLEKGVNEKNRKELNKFYFVDTYLQNYLYLYGSPTAYCAVLPGQLIGFADGQYDDAKALVIKVDEAGNPLQVVTIKDKCLTLEDRKIEIKNIYEVFDMSFTPRAWPQNPEMAAFYGNWSGLSSIIKEQATGQFDYTYTFEDNTYTIRRYTTGDLLKFTILNSAPWIQERFLKAGERVSDLEAVINTFEAGLQPYTAGTLLPAGTVVFTNGNNVGIVVNNDNNGDPVLIIAASGDSYLYHAHQYFLKINKDEIVKYWVPTTKAYTYTTANSPAFTDLNRWLGKVRLFWKTYDYRFSLFKIPYLLDKYSMTPELLALLSAGPVDYNGWKKYLDGFGKGLQKPADTTIEPGDFLLVNYERENTVAIAMDAKTMTLIDSGDIKWPEIAGVEWIWKPSTDKKTGS